MKKNQNLSIGSTKWFWPNNLHMMDRLIIKGGASKPNTFSDWLDNLINPCVLLLIISQLGAIPLLVLWVGLNIK
jgi:hypothetical protein